MNEPNPSMMQGYLCLEAKCQGKSRIIIDVDEIISKSGEHQFHDCIKITLVQEKLKSYAKLHEITNMDQISSKEDGDSSYITEQYFSLIK